MFTFGTLASPGRDPGRGTGDGPALRAVRYHRQMVPNELNITIDRALEMSQELRTMYEDG